MTLEVVKVTRLRSTKSGKATIIPLTGGQEGKRVTQQRLDDRARRLMGDNVEQLFKATWMPREKRWLLSRTVRQEG